MAKKRTPTPLADLIRQAVKDQGITGYRLGKLTGLDEGTISRFLAGKGTTLDSADRLMRALGFEIVPPTKGGK